MPTMNNGPMPSAPSFETRDAITIYDSDYRLIAWNEPYAEFGITPRTDIVDGLHLADTYALASRLGVFGRGEPNAIARQKMDEALNQESPECEILSPEDGGSIFVRRFFIPGIGVAAVFSNCDHWSGMQKAEFQRIRTEVTQKTERACRHEFNNKLCVIANTIELATMTGDLEVLANLNLFGNSENRKKKNPDCPQTKSETGARNSSHEDDDKPVQKPRVLLVEDEVRVAFSTQVLLAEMGFETITVNSGEEAIRLIGLVAGQFDVVLSDFRLRGDSNGIDVLRFVRSEQPDLPFIMCTATPEDCPNIGNIPMIQKPVVWKELTQLIDASLLQR